MISRPAARHFFKQVSVRANLTSCIAGEGRA